MGGRGQSSGRSGDRGGGDRGAAQRLEEARQAYARELQQSRDALQRLQGQQQRGGNGATPEQHEYSRSAPGNEGFKQDFSGWEALRKDIDLALEQYEASVSARLGARPGDERLSAGGSERVPDRYQPIVSRYFESIAKVKK